MTTLIVTSSQHLDQASDAVLQALGLDRSRKLAVLNALAASLAGPRKNWGAVLHHQGTLVSPRLRGGPDLHALVHPTPPVAADTPTHVALTAANPVWKATALEDIVDALRFSIQHNPELRNALESHPKDGTQIDTLVEKAGAYILAIHETKGDLESAIAQHGTEWLYDDVVSEEWSVLMDLIVRNGHGLHTQAQMALARDALRGSFMHRNVFERATEQGLHPDGQERLVQNAAGLALERMQRAGLPTDSAGVILTYITHHAEDLLFP